MKNTKKKFAGGEKYGKNKKKYRKM